MHLFADVLFPAAQVLLLLTNQLPSSLYPVGYQVASLYHCSCRCLLALLFVNTKCYTTFSISISVTNLCVSSLSIASSFCLCFNSKSRLNLSTSLGAF